MRTETRNPLSLVRLVALAFALVVAALIAPRDSSAEANQVGPLHFKFYRAATSAPLDSTLVTAATALIDTTQWYSTDQFSGWNGTANNDTTLAVIGEATGTFANTDTLYLTVQGTTDQGLTSVALGQSARAVMVNLRLGVAVNNTGSQTFVWKLPANLGGNTWLFWKNIRFILQGDATGDGLAANTRLTLVNRSQ
jgi:hypothetical protein